MFVTPAPPPGQAGPTYADLGGDPVPPDFFGPGSDPFDGIIYFKGNPFPVPGPYGPVSVDTIVERLTTAELPDPYSGVDTVDTQMLALNLVSTTPITITYYGDPFQTSLYEVQMCLSSVSTQPIGSMTIRHLCPAGGRFDSHTPVVPKLIFTNISGGPGVATATLDPAPQLDFHVYNGCWSHSDPGYGIYTTLGGSADHDCDGSSVTPEVSFPPSTTSPYGFFVGVCWLPCDGSPSPPTASRKRLTLEVEQLAAHGILPPEEEEGDQDGDGIHDTADNCPYLFNAMQRDVDDDYVGDECDNCEFVYNPFQEDSDGNGIGDACQVSVTVIPDPPVAGQNVTIQYNSEDSPLEGAPQVYLHYGFNDWNPVISPDPAMTQNVSGQWEITVPVAPFAAGSHGLNMAFNDGAGLWDNNNGNDWHFEVINTTGVSPWVMDGYVDRCATLIATSTNGDLHLYAGLRNGFLYVATERSNDLANRDHFIFVAAMPGAPAGQPWAKAGTVAQWDAYLAQEESNGWVGWFDLVAGTNRQNVGQSMDLPYLEGQFDLAAEIGAIPAQIHLAMGAWGTNNGDPLIPTLQILPGNGDGNIDANEYALVQTLDIQVVPSFDPADFDEDCDVDVDDYDEFQACLNGPGNPPADTCTVDADLDHDGGDVDLADFAIFQESFTGF